MRHITMKQQLILTVSISIVLLFVLLFIIVLPQMNRIKNIQKDITTLHAHTHDIYSQRRDLVHPTLHSLEPIFQFTHNIIERQPTHLDQLAIITALEDLSEIAGTDQELSVSIKETNEKEDTHFVLLQKNNITTAIHYPIPIHLQPAAKFLRYKRAVLKMLKIKQKEFYLCL